MRILSALLLSIFILSSCSEKYDTIIRNGTIYDGSGKTPYKADIGIIGDTIASIGDLSKYSAQKEIDAEGLAVSPGFINMLSWSIYTLMMDGNSQSDIRQGVTLEVFGEGFSMGPVSAEDIAQYEAEGQPIQWRTLGEYLEFLENSKVATNVASFVGATTLRTYAVGYEDRPPTPEELDTMRFLTRQAMEEGALGIGSSLIYPPGFYAETDELIEISKVAAEYGGMYISHMRSEGNRFLESLDELIRISSEAGLPAEVYHLKASGASNWDKLDQAIAKIDSARAAGLQITTDMYTYTAGSTGLVASMPPWVQEGGAQAGYERLKDPAIRARIKKEMTTPSDDWENLLLATGSPERCILVGFQNDSLKYLTGKTLAEVAKMRNTSPEETVMDLIWQDQSGIQSVYFLMSEENVKKQLKLPYMSFGSDSPSMAPEGAFIESSVHPRAYGNFARLLGKYVREEKIIPLEEAIYKLTSLPAKNLKIRQRGALKEGFYADIAIFDPEQIADHATYDNPHQYSTGMVHVFVNGTQVLENGEHTDAKPGRVVRGPGWTGWKKSNLN